MDALQWNGSDTRRDSEPTELPILCDGCDKELWPGDVLHTAFGDYCGDECASEGAAMPKTSEMRESKFLKQSDVGTGVLWTIEGCERHNVAKEGAEPEYKWALTFHEIDKPLVLNSTNIQLCERIFQSDDTDHWVDKKIVLYTDPNVSYGGKVVGGIRVRAPKVKPQAKPVPVPEPVNELTDEDIPF